MCTVTVNGARQKWVGCQKAMEPAKSRTSSESRFIFNNGERIRERMSAHPGGK